MNRKVLVLLAMVLQVVTLSAISKTGVSGFIRNDGFIKDQNGNLNQEVLYLCNGKGMNVQLRRAGFSYDLYQVKKTVESVAGIGMDTDYQYQYHFNRLDISFPGASQAPQIVASGQEDRSWYNEATGGIRQQISTFTKVIYKSVYPGIDLEFIYSEKQGFKYNINLQPGADLSRFRFSVTGSTELKLDKEGSLIIASDFGNVVEKIPFSYCVSGKSREQVKAFFYEVTPGVYGIATDKNISGKAAVIDPLPWLTYYGGEITEYPCDILKDPAGFIYVTGVTNSTTKIATAGAFKTTLSSSTNNDGFLAKFTVDGQLVWGTYFGGASDDRPTDLAFDPDSNIVMAGYTGSTNGYGTPGVYQTSNAGSTDCFLMKFNRQGGLVWSTYYGTVAVEMFNGLTVDLGGYIYTCGYSMASGTLPFTGVHQNTVAGGNDAIITKWSSSGNLIWATYYGGTNADYAYSIACDTSGYLYLSCYTGSNSGIATTGALNTVLKGSTDGAIARFDTTGNLVFGTYLGGPITDYLTTIRHDGKGSIYATGYTYSNSDIATSGAYQTTLGGLYDGWVVKMTETGTLLWSTYLGGSGFDYVYGADVDKEGDLYVTGATQSKNNIATPGAFKDTIDGTYTDIFLTSFTGAGGVRYSTYLGAGSNDNGRKIEVLDKQSIFIVGETQTDTGLATPGAYQETLGGITDIFLLRYSEPIVTTNIDSNRIIADQVICSGSSPSVLTGTTPVGGNGIYSYFWIQSPSGLPGTFTAAPGMASSASYSPGQLFSTTYFKRIVYSGAYTDTSNVVQVEVSSDLNAGFTVNKMIQCLKDNRFVFTDTTTAPMGGTLTHHWDFGNGSTSLNAVDSISYLPSTRNNYTVTLVTTLNGGCNDTSFIKVFINSNPPLRTINGNALLKAGDTSSYSVPAAIGSTYRWWYTNGTGRNSGNPLTIRWQIPGTVDLKMVETGSGNCTGDTSYLSITIRPATGIEEELVSKLIIFPNPSDGNFKVSFDRQGFDPSQLKIDLYDLNGSEVNSSVNAEMNSLVVNTDLPEGLYIIRILTNEGSSIYKKIQIRK